MKLRCFTSYHHHTKTCCGITMLLLPVFFNYLTTSYIIFKIVITIKDFKTTLNSTSTVCNLQVCMAVMLILLTTRHHNVLTWHYHYWQNFTRLDQRNVDNRERLEDTNEGWAGRRIRTEQGFCMRLEDICSALNLQPLAHSIACSDTYQQWLTLAQAGWTK